MPDTSVVIEQDVRPYPCYVCLIEEAETKEEKFAVYDRYIGTLKKLMHDLGRPYDDIFLLYNFRKDCSIHNPCRIGNKITTGLLGQ